MARDLVPPDMDLEARRDLRVLEAVAENQRITQRGLADHLGIALGLANVYVKRLARKGYIKCINIQSNRILYLITPKGIAEKTRLTYEYMQYSLHLYGQVRIHLRAVLQPLAGNGHKRIAIYGTGEAAELAYLSVKEAGLELAAIFDDQGGRMFLGMPVQDIRDHGVVLYDLLVVAALARPEAAVTQLVQWGVPAGKLQTLRPATAARTRRADGNGEGSGPAPPTAGGTRT
jgi:DNA-binding MarR family transcriptional regulator